MTSIDTYHFKTERTIQHEQYEISDFPNVNEVGLDKSIMVGDLNLPFRSVYSQTPASSPGMSESRQPDSSSHRASVQCNCIPVIDWKAIVEHSIIVSRSITFIES